MKVATAALGALLLLAGCAAGVDVLHRGDELTWEQYESIRPGMTAGEIREIYGEPKETRLEAGRVWRYSYLCWDADGRRLRTLDLEFDRQEILVEKSLW